MSGGCCEKVKRGISVRAVLKTISYRLIGTGVTALLAYIFVQDVKSALSIGALDFTAKLVIYYVHERVWDCCAPPTRAPSVEDQT